MKDNHGSSGLRTRTVSRRVVMAGGAAALAVGVGLRATRAQAAAPLRVGVLNSFSKSFALIGQSNLDAMNLYFERQGGEVAGRKIEVIREDDEINPQVGLQKIRKLVESDKVDIVCGPQASNVGMAILGYMKDAKVPLVISGAGASALTWQRIPNVFRSSLSTWQICHPQAQWVYDNVAKEVFLSGSDFAGGRDVLREFKSAFTKIGGKVLGEVYPPLGTTDFSPYLSTIRGSGAKAVYNFYAGSDAVRFVKQAGEVGLSAQAKLIGYASMVDNDTFSGQGKSAIGVLTANIYSPELDNAANKEFVAAYKKKYNSDPSLYSEYGYTCGRVVVEAVKKLNGNTGDLPKFIEALKAVRFDAPRGPFEFDPVTHNVINDVYMFEAVERNGKIENKAIATVKRVKDPGVKDG